MDEGGHGGNCFMAFNYCENLNYMSSNCITDLNHFKTDNYSLVKTQQGFSSISFCGGKTPRFFYFA